MFVETGDAECSHHINTVGISQRNSNVTQLKCRHKYNDDCDNADHDHDDDPVTMRPRFHVVFTCSVWV